MNNLMIEANELLKKGGFEYAFCGGQVDLISPSVKRSISPEDKVRRFHRGSAAISLT